MILKEITIIIVYKYLLAYIYQSQTQDSLEIPPLGNTQSAYTYFACWHGLTK